MKLKIQVLKGEFSVCRLKNTQNVRIVKPFLSLTVTDEEISLVCPSETAPLDCLEQEKNWRCMKILGPLDFSLIGILADVSAVLAKKDISIFAVSTFYTDYILVKSDRIDGARAALTDSGYEFTD